MAKTETKKSAAPAFGSQYGVIVLCSGEAEHEEIYNALRAQGYKCRVVCT